MLTLGILIFHFFPHPVKKPRDAISIPDGGLLNRRGPEKHDVVVLRMGREELHAS